jgi:GMP synthase (glutamine-hydrolysing)
VSYPWLTQVKALVHSAVEDGTPTLGICLGMQLATVALGGAVHRNPAGQQIGVLPVGWRPAAEEDALFASVTGMRRAVQWNDDVVRRLPSGAVVLAQTAGGEIQAARFAPRVWGVQWHPELGAQIAARWADADRDSVWERGVDVDEYVADVAAAEEELRGWRSLVRSLVALTPDLVGDTCRG